MGELSDKYSLPITPPGWTFSIWGIIYLWQAAWLIYILYHSIRYSAELKSQNILTFGTLFYISWIFSCIFNGSWIALFALERLTLSAIVLVSISISLYINGYVSHKYIGSASDPSNNEIYPSYLNSKTTRTLYRILVLNGIAFYATWCSIAQCLYRILDSIGYINCGYFDLLVLRFLLFEKLVNLYILSICCVVMGIERSFNQSK